MVLEDRLSSVRTILQAHNEKSQKPIDIEAFFQKLEEMGGTTDEALSEATWEDLEACGAPRILARKIASVLRKEDKEEKAAPGPAQTIVLSDDDPEKRAKRLTPRELIAEYDPKHPKNPIGERLKELAEGRKFLVFKDGSVDVDSSRQLFDQLDDYGERDEFTVDGTPRKVYNVGDRPGRTVDEHPLFVNVPLRPDGKSEADCEWGNVPLKIRQIYRLAVKIGELDPENYREVELFREATERDETEICQLYRKAAVKWGDLAGLGKLPALKVSLGKKTKKEKEDTGTQNPFGTNRAT